MEYYRYLEIYFSDFVYVFSDRIILWKVLILIFNYFEKLLPNFRVFQRILLKNLVSVR